MAIRRINPDLAYGIGDALIPLAPIPIIAKRDPGAADQAVLGTVWVNKVSNGAFILTSVVNNLANWDSISGGAGLFTALTVNPGPTSLSTTGNGAVSIGNTTNTGAVTLTAGTGNLSIVGAGHTVSIASDSAANTVIVGSTNSTSATTIRAGTAGITLTAPFVALPGPVYIYTGAGVPSGALALHVGDLYINTTAATATTRMYIATAVGTFTNITCAA